MTEIEDADLNPRDKIAKEYICEDEDVIWEGSPLHEHLTQQNLELFPQSTKCVSNDCSPLLDLKEEAEDRHAESKTMIQPEPNGNVVCEKDGSNDKITSNSILSSAKSFAWPESRRLEVLQVEVARQLLESDLLVKEDEDFINNFLLTDDALEDYHRYTTEGGTSNILGDVLLFSGR